MKKSRNKPKPSPSSTDLSAQSIFTQPNTNLTFTRTEVSAYSGILPPPEMLAQYGNIVPDAPERILRMAEEQSTHRRNLESWVVKGDMVRSYLGVLCALVTIILTLYLGATLVREGHEIGGYIFGGLGLTTLAGTFIYGTRSRKEERLRRDQQNKALTGRR